MKSAVVLIGYSGHAFVAADILLLMGHTLAGYCDQSEKSLNPYQLPFLGPESADSIGKHDYFVAIGDNRIRRLVSENMLAATGRPAITIEHPSAVKGHFTSVQNGVMIGAGVIINPLAQIGDGVICNTGCIIEHECQIGDYAHIAPGAVLAGNVQVGEGSFIGANAVVKQGISIGKNVIIGAGAVVIRDVADHCKIAGNPGKSIR